MSRGSISIIFLVALAVGAHVGAQQTYEIQQAQPNDNRLTTARQLMRNNNWEAAAAMLELVYEAEPRNQTVINLLKNCYSQLKQYGKSETIIRRQIDQSPQNLNFRLELAETLANQGQLENARDAYRQAQALITTPDFAQYLLLVRSQLSHAMPDDALAVIDSFRKQTKDSLVFALERGSVMESRRDYKTAIKEYLPVLAADTTMDAIEVERRIVMLLEFPESSREVEAILVAETQQKPRSRAVRLLSDYYIKAHRFDQAFAFATKRDSLEGMKGGSLVYLMRQCYERKLFTEAAKFGEYILSRYSASPMHIETRLIYARSLARLGKTDQAIALFDSVVVLTPRDADKGQAIYEIGEIYFDLLGDYRTALVYFDSVVNRYRMGMSYIQAHRSRPICHLRLGDLPAARSSFEFLRSHPITDDMTEETTFYLGMISFYEGKYDSAETAFRKLMVDHPTGFYVNDALQLVMVLTEAKDAPELLRDYGEALFTQERRQLDSTRTWFDRIARAENPALADVALYRLTLLNVQMGDSAAALESINRLDSGFPDSYYRPYGLKLKADMLMDKIESRDTARAIYRTLLEQFPNYPFASDVRKRLKQLETDFKVG